MVNNFLINLVMDMMLYVNNKQLMVKHSYIIHNLIISDQHIVHYHNVNKMLYLDHIVLLVILQDHNIYLIVIVQIVNKLHGHILINQMLKI